MTSEFVLARLKLKSSSLRSSKYFVVDGYLANSQKVGVPVLTCFCWGSVSSQIITKVPSSSNTFQSPQASSCQDLTRE